MIKKAREIPGNYLWTINPEQFAFYLTEGQTVESWVLAWKDFEFYPQWITLRTLAHQAVLSPGNDPRYPAILLKEGY